MLNSKYFISTLKHLIMTDKAKILIGFLSLMLGFNLSD